MGNEFIWIFPEQDIWILEEILPPNGSLIEILGYVGDAIVILVYDSIGASIRVDVDVCRGRIYLRHVWIWRGGTYPTPIHRGDLLYSYLYEGTISIAIDCYDKGGI